MPSLPLTIYNLRNLYQQNEYRKPTCCQQHQSCKLAIINENKRGRHRFSCMCYTNLGVYCLTTNHQFIFFVTSFSLLIIIKCWLARQNWSFSYSLRSHIWVEIKSKMYVSKMINGFQI